MQALARHEVTTLTRPQPGAVTPPLGTRARRSGLGVRDTLSLLRDCSPFTDVVTAESGVSSRQIEASFPG